MSLTSYQAAPPRAMKILGTSTLCKSKNHPIWMKRIRCAAPVMRGGRSLKGLRRSAERSAANDLGAKRARIASAHDTGIRSPSAPRLNPTHYLQQNCHKPTILTVHGRCIGFSPRAETPSLVGKTFIRLGTKWGSARDKRGVDLIPMRYHSAGCGMANRTRSATQSVTQGFSAAHMMP